MVESREGIKTNSDKDLWVFRRGRADFHVRVLEEASLMPWQLYWTLKDGLDVGIQKIG